MHKSLAFLITLGCALAFAARAQDTNALKTSIGLFEAQTGVIIIKGFNQVGSVSTGAAVISVRAKESASLVSGHKDYGIAVDIELAQGQDRAYVDYDELDSLQAGIDYLGKITFNATPLPGFEASFTTKSGLRVIAFGSNRQGAIHDFLQYNDGPRIPLTTDQLTQLKNLIDMAKTSLDSLKAAR